MSGTDSQQIGVTILGATGTIGVNTLDVIQRHAERFRVVALTANGNHERLLEQCQQFLPDYAVMVDENAAEILRANVQKLGLETQVLQGESALAEVAALDSVDYVMAAIVGAAGLLPTLAAAQAGKRVMLANKEALVMSGHLFMQAISDNHAELLPIDSEHNAIFQCMPANYADGLAKTGVEKILLTASGGPFLKRDLATLAQVTPEEAVAHPNWVMGRKISVDSATMMNKGLEVIEACWLFACDADLVQVVVHPQSIIHSMVAYNDGSVLAQLGNPDMRTPIAYALGWPERVQSGVAALDIFAAARLDFVEPDFSRFPCLRLAYEAYAAGGTATAILNAANEIAVEAFLNRQIAFTMIPELIESCLSKASIEDADSLAVVLAADTQARQLARDYILSAGVA